MQFLVTTAIVFVMALSASAQDNAKIQEEVIKVDRARVAAFYKGDGDAWAKHVSDDCIWTNMATGVVEQNKAEVAANITKRGPTEGTGERTDEKFHVEETRVVQTGATNDGRRFVRVYVKGDAGWQMIARIIEKARN